MVFGIGPSPFWMRTKESADYFAIRCPVATTLGDGSRIFCKTGGRAWIVAPSCTEVFPVWARGTATCVLLDKCCIFEWATLNIRLVSCGFNPCDWIVPTLSQLQSAYTCRTFWDPSGYAYWSSTELSASTANNINWSSGTLCGTCCKTCGFYVRAIRCVTY